MKLNSQRSKKPNLPTGASIHRLSAITQPPVEKTVVKRGRRNRAEGMDGQR
jgi:hypothetical protein